MLTAGKIKAADALGYIIAQCIGAVIAAWVLFTIQKGLPGWQPGEWALGANGWGEATSRATIWHRPSSPKPSLPSFSFS